MFSNIVNVIGSLFIASEIFSLVKGLADKMATTEDSSDAFNIGCHMLSTIAIGFFAIVGVWRW